MSEENLRIVQAVYDAFARGDQSAMLALIDPSVVVTQLPDQPDPQTFQGHEGLLQGMAEWIGMWDDYSIEIRNMRDLDDRVLASCRQTGSGKGSGIPMEHGVYFLFTLRGGKVIRWQMFQSEQAALAAARSG